MRRILSIGLFIFLWALTSQPIQAETALLLRALAPNPSSGKEWIALENTNVASVSATGYQLKDGAGSVKTFTLGGFVAAGEVRLFDQTQTKISLNNDQDWVELWYNNELLSMSDIYDGAQKGMIFLNSESGWIMVTEEDWLQRFTARDWQAPDSENRENTPSPQLVFTPAPQLSSVPKLKSPFPQMSEEVQERKELVVVSPSPFSGRLPLLSWSVATLSSSSTSSTAFQKHKLPPIPDRSSEVQAWLEWQSWVKIAGGLFLFGGGVMAVWTVPRLVRWYNEYASCLYDYDNSS